MPGKRGLGKGVRKRLKGHQESVGGGEYVRYLDSSDDVVGINICQNVKLHTLNTRS